MSKSPFALVKLDQTLQMKYTKAKQPESGHLCGNITEFGEVEGSPEPTGVILPYSIPDEGCFVFISYCSMVLSHSKLRYIR